MASGGAILFMRIGVLTPVRLVGEGIAASLAACAPAFEAVTARDFPALRALADGHFPPELVIVDVTQRVALPEVRAFHAEYPDLPLLALGLRERETEIVEHGRAGFAGYIRRDEGVGELRGKVEDALAGRLSCPPEITAGIMRALFRAAPPPAACDLSSLTRREGDVARLVSRGLANKEIACHLRLSESTVKHHVHAILAKLGLTRRTNLMRSMRDDPWFSESGRRSG
jgi:DNA-binding NarL/FixJ family response regulator